MLCSGNDCGTAIAEHISGSEEAFAELMNTEAAKLGATGTHFVNPHGLHDDDHYTTAYDLYLIFNAACKYQLFMDIISMDSYSAEITGADGECKNSILGAYKLLFGRSCSAAGGGKCDRRKDRYHRPGRKLRDPL